MQLQYKVVACSALLWLVGWAALCWFIQLRWELFCNIILSGYCGREQTARQAVHSGAAAATRDNEWLAMVVDGGALWQCRSGDRWEYYDHCVWGTLQGIVRDSVDQYRLHNFAF